MGVPTPQWSMPKNPAHVCPQSGGGAALGARGSVACGLRVKTLFDLGLAHRLFFPRHTTDATPRHTFTCT